MSSSVNMVTSIVVLGRWLGRTWVQKHLIPAINDVIKNSTNSEATQKDGNEEGKQERIPEEFIPRLAPMFSKLEVVAAVVQIEVLYTIWYSVLGWPHVNLLFDYFCMKYF